MHVAAILALQTLPFAGLVLAGGEDRDLFTVLYVAALGLIVTLDTLLGGTFDIANAFGGAVR
ncbi:hypothetical protein [Methylobacterium sp. E-045]|jgi:hypothetical protein|uniref:hypothetical protein n=1 Tax=Methylobacterium sp. E-045 TaxID=2836575 RepID=UPI001FB88C01|nr:hypothetical protein [Methylobacterium sp. E-045]MCJ2131214.1 hypothetical protein [Methylobacterium sp. E-045]